MSAAIPELASLYEQLSALPENMVGEIINGRLYAHPRPAKPHAIITSVLGMDIGSSYHRGRGGPGGWWIIDEPELHFIRDVEVLAPDLAGWRRERLPHMTGDHRFEVIPDWVCKVLSPSTAKIDRFEKMPVYAQYGVPYLWLVDPQARTLETFELREQRWTVLGLFKDADHVRAAPFQEVDVALADLWPDEG